MGFAKAVGMLAWWIPASSAEAERLLNVASHRAVDHVPAGGVEVRALDSVGHCGD